jgi:hypothetical protein
MWVLAGLCLLFTVAVGAQDLALSALTALRESDTFLAARLSSPETKQILETVAAMSFDSPDSWEAELRARRVSLGRVEGLVLQGTRVLCGGTGNCEIAVLRRVGDRWMALFADQAPIGDGFALLSHHSDGIRDLLIAANESAEAERYVVYRFDGRYYQPSQCYEKRQARLGMVPCP